ncbi:MAG: response regulator, partial [Terriglobales bacterium]
GVKVLIVDDNRTNLKILERMLGGWAMRLTTAESAEEAMVQLCSAQQSGNPYALVLTDLLMPQVDGFGLIERIRQKPELASATIMMLTSAGQRGDAARCEELGVSAYLMKPIRQSELREAIAQVLGVHHGGDDTPLVTRFSVGQAESSSESLKILLAEDNAVNQRVAVRLLQKSGHSVAVAANGREVLEMLQRDQFDLILMDVQMPEMDGFETTAEIRRSEKHTGLHQPIVAMTAHAMKGDRERCLFAGMDSYLAKPIHSDELNMVLKGYLPRANLAKSAGKGQS